MRDTSRGLVAGDFADAPIPVDGVDQAFLPRVDRQEDIRARVRSVDQDRRGPGGSRS